MVKRTLTVLYDPDIDFLEVLFEGKAGYYHVTDDDPVMVRYDEHGKVIGFAIEGVKELQQPLELEFSDKEPQQAVSPLIRREDG